MDAIRKTVAMAAVALTMSGALGGAAAQPTALEPGEILGTWYRLMLELVRHTATYSPPVASRAFAYVGVTAFEAVASGSDGLRSLAGQLNGLQTVPRREAAQTYDEAVVLHSAVATVVRDLFSNTGPTGQMVLAALERDLGDGAARGVPADVVARSETHGRAVADHILAWSRDDGGAAVENMGFPLEYALSTDPSRWVPTSLIQMQQAPLLPGWGENRTFAMPDGASCSLPPPPAYSEDESSDFYREALEVYETTLSLTPDEAEIARFWSDDPMLSPTPPGHWVSIAMQIMEREGTDIETSVDLLARLGVALADSFIGCWQAKYQYDLVRPLTYIRRLIDPAWDTLVFTPPFPEYPSGHSTQSAAAAEVLTDMFGEDFAFADATREGEGVEPRFYPDFWAAAEEAGISRLYGGIHFRAAIERGLDQGRCIAAYTNALRTRR